jgi:hypothetical protein
MNNMNLLGGVGGSFFPHSTSTVDGKRGWYIDVNFSNGHSTAGQPFNVYGYGVFESVTFRYSTLTK